MKPKFRLRGVFYEIRVLRHLHVMEDNQIIIYLPYYYIGIGTVLHHLLSNT